MPSRYYRPRILAGRLRAGKFQDIGLGTFWGPLVLILALGGMVVFFTATACRENDTTPKDTATWALAAPIFRYEVRLAPKQVPSINRCIGTWIHPQWILSAAHCGPDQVSVLYPLPSQAKPSPQPQSNSGPPLKITRSLLHPIYDIALLHSEMPYAGPIFSPSSLSKAMSTDKEIEENEKTNESRNAYSPGAWVVPAIDLRPSPPDLHTGSVHSRLTLHRHDDHILRFQVRQGDLQRGDSGAPLLFEATRDLVGILIAGSPPDSAPSLNPSRDRPRGWQTAQRLDHPEVATWLQQSMASLP